MHIKFLIILIIFLFTACQSNEKYSIKELNKNAYSISYPPNLKLEENGSKGSEFALFTEKSDVNDQFVENINLVIQNLENLNVDLNKFVEISENQIMADGKLISSERLRQNNSEFQKLIYSLPINDFELKFIQYYFVANRKAYILTFTSEAKEFEKYSSDMEKIMSTFRVH